MSRPHGYCRNLSSTADARRKRAWRARQDPDYLRAMNRRHQRAKRARDKTA